MHPTIAATLRILILTTAATLCALPLRAQIIHGTVVDGTSGATVRGAHIALLNLEGRTLGVAQSDSDGKFALRAPGEGRYVLRATHFAFVHAVTPAFELGAAATVRVEFELAPDPIRFDPLTVIAERRQQLLEMAGFYQRQRIGFGKFITRDKIEASHAIYIADVLRRYPGVTLVRHPDSGEPEVILRGSAMQSLCFPSVMIDGMVVRHGGAGDVSLESLVPSPDEVEAIEVYPGLAGVPPQLTGMNSPCGALVFWMRR
jgi:hypothetical protein